MLPETSQSLKDAKGRFRSLRTDLDRGRGSEGFRQKKVLRRIIVEKRVSESDKDKEKKRKKVPPSTNR